MFVLFLKFILHQASCFHISLHYSHLLLMSFLWVNLACPKLTHPHTLKICLIFHIPYSVKGPEHLPSHLHLLPYWGLQYFPPLPTSILGTQCPWSGLSQRPSKLSTLFQSLHIHHMHNSLVNHSEALFCFVMSYSCSENFDDFPFIPENKAHIP